MTHARIIEVEIKTERRRAPSVGDDAWSCRLARPRKKAARFGLLAAIYIDRRRGAGYFDGPAFDLDQDPPRRSATLDGLVESAAGPGTSAPVQPARGHEGGDMSTEPNAAREGAAAPVLLSIHGPAVPAFRGFPALDPAEATRHAATLTDAERAQVRARCREALACLERSPAILAHACGKQTRDHLWAIRELMDDPLQFRPGRRKVGADD
jgi:hypothetical protein